MFNRFFLLMLVFLGFTFAEASQFELSESVSAKFEAMEAEARFLQRIDRLTKPLAFPMEQRNRLEDEVKIFDISEKQTLNSDAKEDKFLFKRKYFCFGGCGENLEQSKAAYHVIEAKKVDAVQFNYSKLTPFDHAGTCSAMALDFLARYNSQCALMDDPEDKKVCVQSFAPFYESNTTTFSSRQAAYNTIEVDREIGLRHPEFIKNQKMQSLANFHNLQLTPVTQSIKTYSSINLAEIVEALPFSTYIVRALHPYEMNEKLEWFGHTMILIKEENGLSLFYDNSQGVEDISGEVGIFVEERLRGWGIEEFRIYAATCSGEGCVNLSAETL